MNLPAHETKHLDTLDYLLPNGTRVIVHQDGTTPDSTGRTVWLGAQVLAVYLHDLHKLGSLVSAKVSKQRRPTAIDVGAGTGLSALSLASIGYNVLATDLEVIVQGILSRNIATNTSTVRGANGFEPSRIQTHVLDWFESPTEWTWPRPEHDDNQDRFAPPFDLVVSADTVYTRELSQPLLRTLHALSNPSSKSTTPLVYLALERRDPELVTEFLKSAEQDWGFKCTRVDPDRVRKLVESNQGGLGWQDESVWEGIEIWKLKLKKTHNLIKRSSKVR
ncbi:uncharacterized protein JCM15063_002211 [Sporobolomyces koalae]|uniref:uncharacterized protein n=1 Tax=Sporobolomyces koalae TaxID=500713 RepID=UPI00317489C0